MLRVLSKRETQNAAMNAEEKGAKHESQLLWYCYYHNIPVKKINDWNGKQVIAGVLINPPDDADYSELCAPDDPRRLKIIEREISRVQGTKC